MNKIINEIETQELRELYNELAEYVSELSINNNKEEYEKCNKILNHYRNLLRKLDETL